MAIRGWSRGGHTAAADSDGEGCGQTREMGRKEVGFTASGLIAKMDNEEKRKNLINAAGLS